MLPSFVGIFWLLEQGGMVVLNLCFKLFIIFSSSVSQFVTFVLMNFMLSHPHVKTILTLRKSIQDV